MRREDIELVEEFIEGWLGCDADTHEALWELVTKLQASAWVDGSNDYWGDEEE